MARDDRAAGPARHAPRITRSPRSHAQETPLMHHAHQHRGTTPENVQNMSQPFGERPGPRPDRRRRDGFPPVPDDAAWFRGDGPVAAAEPAAVAGAGSADRPTAAEASAPAARLTSVAGSAPDREAPVRPGRSRLRAGSRRSPARGRGRGPGRAGRGDVRAAVLLLLAEQPMHGYQVIQEIAERSEGQWRPSPRGLPGAEPAPGRGARRALGRRRAPPRDAHRGGRRVRRGARQ